MIHESVNQILAVEEEVAKQMAEANEYAKEMMLRAERESEKIRTDVVARMKEERRQAAEEARADGEKQYNQILSSGKQNAQRLTASTDTTAAVEFIKKKVLSAYVNC